MKAISRILLAISLMGLVALLFSQSPTTFAAKKPFVASALNNCAVTQVQLRGSNDPIVSCQKLEKTNTGLAPNTAPYDCSLVPPAEQKYTAKLSQYLTNSRLICFYGYGYSGLNYYNIFALGDVSLYDGGSWIRRYANNGPGPGSFYKVGDGSGINFGSEYWVTQICVGNVSACSAH